MEDKILVILNEDANHTFESEESVIGRVGEGGIAQFEITIPEKLTNGSLYLDFKKPNGEKIRTKRLDINEGKAFYDVEKYLLTDDGEIKVQAVFVTSSGKTWKSSKKKYNILKSVNAVHDIPDNDKDDFITEAQKVVFGFEDRLKALEQWIDNKDYVNLNITSFSASTSTYEIGKKVDKVTLNWSYNNNKEPESQLFGETPKSGGTFSGTDIGATARSQTIENKDGFTTNKSWRLFAVGERGETTYKDAGITFLNGVYYGRCEAPADGKYTSAFILDAYDKGKGTLKRSLTSSKVSSFSVTAGEGEYIYYCLPTRIGKCVFTVGILSGGFTLVEFVKDDGSKAETIDFTNESGYTEPYYIYRSYNQNLGTQTVKVS